MGECCKTIVLRVLVQENGILRLADTGRLIGRLYEDDEVSFDKLSDYALPTTR